MKSNLATTDTDVMRKPRPLAVLIPLIKEDLQHGRDAAERAGMPYYQAAGEKLNEAKAQLKHGEFIAWCGRNFNVKMRQLQVYMALAGHAQENEIRVATRFSSLSDFERKTGLRDPEYNLSDAVKPQSWHEPVKQIVSRIDTETLNLKRNELKRADEREAQRELGRRLIDIGYKVLAQTLHPDKGGSRDAMARLNAVRDRLKQAV